MNPFDSGKTELSVLLVRALTQAGHSVEYFKPVSGHNYWLQHEHTRRCLEQGMLLSRDAARVREEFKPRTNALLSNPIHTLYVPARTSKPLKAPANTLALAGWSSVLVMQRFSRPMSGKVDSTMLVAERLVEEEDVILTYEDLGRLSHDTSVIEVDSLESVQTYEKEHFETTVKESFREVEKQADAVIIEGFNDSAWPFDQLDSVDSVLVTGPGHVYAYDPEKFRRASFMMNRGDLPIREVTFSRVVDLLRPKRLLRLRPGTDLEESNLRELDLILHTGKND